MGTLRNTRDVILHVCWSSNATRVVAGLRRDTEKEIWGCTAVGSCEEQPYKSQHIQITECSTNKGAVPSPPQPS